MSNSVISSEARNLLKNSITTQVSRIMRKESFHRVSYIVYRASIREISRFARNDEKKISPASNQQSLSFLFRDS